MTIEAGQTEPAETNVRCAHGPWSDLALHTIGWRAFQDLCSQVCEVVLGRPVEIFREAQDGGQDAVFLIPSPSNEQFIGTVQCKHTSDAGKALKVGDLSTEIGNVEELVNAGQADTYVFMTNMSVDAQLGPPCGPSCENLACEGHTSWAANTSSGLLGVAHDCARSSRRSMAWET